MPLRSVPLASLRRAGPALALLGTLAGCVPPPGSFMPPPYAAGPIPGSLADRLLTATREAGLPPPAFDQVAAPGESGPVPVFRVRFPDVVFFDTALDAPRPGAGPILDVVAAELREQRPDAFLTVVGHTDAVGSDGYNMGLSRRRAEGVAAILAADGVPPGRVGIAAVGRRQPMDSDATAEGRARNRRVEFLFARSPAAGIAAAAGPDEVVQVARGLVAPAMVAAPLAVDGPPPLAPAPAAIHAPRLAAPRIRPLEPGATPQTPAPIPSYSPNRLETFQPRTLGPTQPF